MEETGVFVAATFIRNLGAATGAVTLYDGMRTCQFWPKQSRLYCPNGPRFPLDAARMVSFTSRFAAAIA